MAEAFAPRLKKPATLDHLRKKEPIEQMIPVVLSDAPVQALEEARRRLFKAEQALDAKPDDKALQREVTAAQVGLDEALAQSDEETVWVRFRSIGRKAYEKMVDKHPPTEKQKEEAEKSDYEAIYNADTFMPALVAAAAIEPKMSVEFAEEIFEEWNSAESLALFFAAMQVCTGRRVSDLGNASGGTRG